MLCVLKKKASNWVKYWQKRFNQAKRRQKEKENYQNNAQLQISCAAFYHHKLS